jgi:hypothetical protein
MNLNSSQTDESTSSCMTVDGTNSWRQDPTVFHRVHKSQRLVPIPSQLIPLHPQPISLRSILIPSSRVLLGVPSGLFPSDFKPCTFSLLSHGCHMHCSPHSPWFDLPDDILWPVYPIQIVQELTTKILKITSLTKSKMNMSGDKMPFDSPVLSKAFFNLRTSSKSTQILTFCARETKSMFLL